MSALLIIPWTLSSCSSFSALSLSSRFSFSVSVSTGFTLLSFSMDSLSSAIVLSLTAISLFRRAHSASALSYSSFISGASRRYCLSLPIIFLPLSRSLLGAGRSVITALIAIVISSEIITGIAGSLPRRDPIAAGKRPFEGCSADTTRKNGTNSQSEYRITDMPLWVNRENPWKISIMLRASVTSPVKIRPPPMTDAIAFWTLYSIVFSPNAPLEKSIEMMKRNTPRPMKIRAAASPDSSFPVSLSSIPSP